MRSYRGGPGGDQAGPHPVFVYEGEEKLQRLMHDGRHSDGFQWGYAGSGPAALARSLLLYHLPNELQDVANTLYQRFKFRFVARFGDAFELPEVVVDGWLWEVTAQSWVSGLPLDVSQARRLQTWLIEQAMERSKGHEEGDSL